MQIIAREVELELMRRSAPRQVAADSQKNAPNVRNRILQTSNKPNHLQRLVCKPIASAKIKETVNVHSLLIEYLNTSISLGTYVVRPTHFH